MDKPLIYHIYWGTAGNAGLYLDEIYQVLKNAGYYQKVFVSYYYPFDYGEKVFFKRTEMEHCSYKGTIRKVVQTLELLYALCVILRNANKDKPSIVNYSYVSSGNNVILQFLKLLKVVSNCHLIFTCHDVIPFENNTKELRIKRKIYALADSYLVHNESSRTDLYRLFDVGNRKCYMHYFPLMDLSKLANENNEWTVGYDFLYIGHMRKEKGVDILFNVWQKFHRQYPGAKLCIAGNPLYYQQFFETNKGVCSESGITLKLGFIKNDDYIKIVRTARCVVFPYTGGTNSGVISTVVSLERDVITSDIGMFADNPFVPKENMFKAGDNESLQGKLSAYMRGELVSDSRERIARYREVFNEQVIGVYGELNDSRNGI